MASNRIEQFRLETLDEPDDKLAPAMRSFFRRLGVGHIYPEVILPTLQDGSSLVTVAIHDRPWPPWGIGAQAVSALAFFHPVSDGHAGLSNVFVVEEEQTSVGLIAAVYREALDQLARRGVERAHFVVRDEAALSMHVLGEAGFQRTSHPFLTEQARYWLYEAELGDHIAALGLQDSSPLELLADQFEGAAFDRVALFLMTLNLSFLPYWQDRLRAPEIIPNTGIAANAECLPPGGTPTIQEEEPSQ